MVKFIGPVLQLRDEFLLALAVGQMFEMRAIVSIMTILAL
jgi:hypothetical protein